MLDGRTGALTGEVPADAVVQLADAGRVPALVATTTGVPDPGMAASAVASLLGGDREQYRAALAVRPESVPAAFNLGVVLEDLNRSDEAVGVYERLVKRERGVADAHFNLARLYERSGRKIASLRHLKEYKRITLDH